MKYSISKNNDGSFFPDIAYAAYYIDDNPGLRKVLYKVSTNRILGYDLLGTDVKYFSEKKFSDGISLDYLLESDKTDITGDVEERTNVDKSAGLEKYYRTLFPTLVKEQGESDREYEIGFFGSILNPGYELITLVVPENIMTVLLYSSNEDPYSTGENNSSVNIYFDDDEVELGKQEYRTNKVLHLYLTYNKPSEYIWKDLGLRKETDIEWWKNAGFIDEGNQVEKKEDLDSLIIPDESVGIIYYVTSEEKYYRYLRSADLNLSYTSWSIDNNGNPLMSDFVLRRDFYNGGGYPVKLGPDNLLYSTNSGSLVGTDIKSRELYRVCNECKTWNKHRKYGVGEVVTLPGGDTEYESLISGNLGNHPYYSNSWVIKGGLSNFLNRQIQVVTSYWDTNDGSDIRVISGLPGKVTPYGAISIPSVISSTFSKEFTVKSNPCYEFSSIYGREELISDDDYTCSGDSHEYFVSINKSWESKISNMIEFCYIKNLGKLSIIHGDVNIEELQKTGNASQLVQQYQSGGWVKPYSPPEVEWSYADYARIYNSKTGEEVDSSEWLYCEKAESGIEPDKKIGFEYNTEFQLTFYSYENSLLYDRVIVEYLDLEDNTIKVEDIDPINISSGTEIIEGAKKVFVRINDTYKYQTVYSYTSYYVSVPGQHAPQLRSFYESRYPRYYFFTTSRLIEIFVYNEAPDEAMIKEECSKVSYHSSYKFEFYTTDSTIMTEDENYGYTGLSVEFKMKDVLGSDWENAVDSYYNETREPKREENRKIQYDAERDVYFFVFDYVENSMEIRVC